MSGTFFDAMIRFEEDSGDVPFVVIRGTPYSFPASGGGRSLFDLLFMIYYLRFMK